MSAKPCPLAVYLAEGLDPTLTPAQAIHAALSQLDDWDWTGGGSAIDFTGLAECHGCEMWMPDTIVAADGLTYCDNEDCLPQAADSDL